MFKLRKWLQLLLLAGFLPVLLMAFMAEQHFHRTHPPVHVTLSPVLDVPVDSSLEQQDSLHATR